MHNEKVNRRNLAIAGVIVIVLLVSTLISNTASIDSASARKYQRHDATDISQAASVRNSCLNPVSNSNTNSNMISNGNCGGTVSQQGKSGQASTPTTVQNANPTVEVQRSTTTSAEPPVATTPPETCKQCFDMFNATQQQALNQTLAGLDNPLRPPNWPSGITTLEELCNAWSHFTEDQKNSAFSDINTLLNQIHIDSATKLEFFRCLIFSVG